MKRLLLFLSMAGIALLTYGDNGGRKFTVVMTGAEEAPGPGDPDGIGFATLRLNPGTQQVCFDISVENIALPATGAHIHEAPVGEPGPIVIGLTAPDETGHSSGCVEADREEILEIIREPEEYYINVHSSEFPAGAVRAQLSK